MLYDSAHAESAIGSRGGRLGSTRWGHGSAAIGQSRRESTQIAPTCHIPLLEALGEWVYSCLGLMRTGYLGFPVCHKLPSHRTGVLPGVIIPTTIATTGMTLIGSAATRVTSARRDHIKKLARYVADEAAGRCHLHL